MHMLLLYVVIHTYFEYLLKKFGLIYRTYTVLIYLCFLKCHNIATNGIKRAGTTWFVVENVLPCFVHVAFYCYENLKI